MQMSAELLSEFDTYYQRAQRQQQALPASSSGQITGSVFDDLACLNNNGSQPSNISTGNLSNGSLSGSKEKSEKDMLQSSNTGKAKAVLSARTSLPREGSKSGLQNNQKREIKFEGQSEVLFDALEDMEKTDDEDDFGDFESGVHVPQPDISNLALISSLDTSLQMDHTEPETAFPSVTSQTNLSHGTQLGLLQPTRRTPLDDEWGDFQYAAETTPVTRDISKQSTDEAPLSSGVHTSDNLSSNSTLKAALLDTLAPRARDSRTDNQIQTLPTNKVGCPSPALEPISSFNPKPSQALQESAAPSNIPPPSILLPLLTTVLQDHYNTIISFRDRATCNPAETKPIHNLLQLLTVAAHVIAGRRLRWKRDMLLAQNMRIGPSHSGKAGGMKLTGIDKAETLREDREVIDLLRGWREHIGRVRSAVGVQTSISTSIPNLAEVMPVKAGKGLLTSAKGCALCGLKREERVGKVDELVEDSFGEWWVEHWGHTTCKSFWDCYHEGLRQR